jgi:hypothetical protein
VRTPPPAGINDSPMDFDQAAQRAMLESAS